MYPTEEQKEFFSKQFGCCRYVYNWALGLRTEHYEATKEHLSTSILQKKLSKELKPEHEWLTEVMSIPLIWNLRNLDVAFKKFFKKKSNYPTFKSKTGPQSFQLHQHYEVNPETGYVKLPKIGNIDVRFHRKFTGRTKTITISKTSSGKYYIYILVDNGLPLPEKQEPTYHATISFSLPDIMNVGDEQINIPLFKEAEAIKLKKLQRNLSRKQEGSANFEKARIKLARLHEEISNRRNDFQHKLSITLVRKNQAIEVRKPEISKEMKDKNKARLLGDLGIDSFIQKLEYKCQWNGIPFKKIDIPSIIISS